ncbi:hypothetical protein F5141DRAFT_1212975 [Pisolithus sp. B1]|nr:hypothetical protein F5141DRAFT_1212975 [Pisolithus sp. B1]
MASHIPHRTPLKRDIQRISICPLTFGTQFGRPAWAKVEGLRKLNQSLKTFNESFASFLYVNALTTDWPQALTDVSFWLAQRRAEENVRMSAEAVSKAAKVVPPTPTPDIDADKTTYTENADYETTFMTAANVTSTSTTTTTAKPPTKAKKRAKPREEGKIGERALGGIVLAIGSDKGKDADRETHFLSSPRVSQHMEFIIEALMDSEGRGVKLIELIATPDPNQARVNKCLIALVNRKLVRKDNTMGTIMYCWHGLP